MKMLFNDRKILYFVLFILILFIFTLTIVYASLSTILEIKGNAEVASASWDIRLDNVKVDSGSVSSTVPTITSATTASFSTTLNKPGDYYQFTIDVVNAGTIDAMIDSVTKTPELTSDQAKYINYIVEYENGDSISVNQLVEANSFVRLKVKVEYRSDISTFDLPTFTETLNLSFTVNYVQSDESSSEVVGNGKILFAKSGNLNTIGSEFCINDECFYLIENDGTIVKMLAKYNLYVGYECSSAADTSCVLYDDPSGIQDSRMLGAVASETVRKGTINFSSKAYWSNEGVVSYIYNENSTLYSYVENYKSYLIENGVMVSNARLISYEELYNLGCDEVVDYGCYKCDTSFSWIYSSSYWAGSLSGKNVVWSVLSQNRYGYYNDYYKKSGAGVRPVIEIPISEFE